MKQTEFFGKHQSSFKIAEIETCDFSSLDSVTTDQLLDQLGERTKAPRIREFIEKNISIQHRYFAKPHQSALDLARQALTRLIDKNPACKEADFIIYAGISNPMPTVCLAALLSNEFGFKKASCWDLKSGCSTGVLALQQAIDWIGKGAQSGLIICSETFSKFTNPDLLQMSLTTGDGACALWITNEPVLKPLSSLHGTDSEFFKSTLVLGKYPVDLKTYHPADYTFSFSDKGQTLQALVKYWKSSLEDVLTLAGKNTNQVRYYFPHQVDSTKNREIGLSAGIAERAMLNTFQNFGNCGCPSVFMNYYERVTSPGYQVEPGDLLLFQAVGGGLSWASLLLEQQPPEQQTLNRGSL